MPWEVTDNYIRSGHKSVGSVCRTITISASKGIKAIYCKYSGGKWAIQSYLFDKAKWSVEKAKAWFKSHSTSETEPIKMDDIVDWFKEKNTPIGGVIGAAKNPMELRSGKPSSDGRVFALTDDSKVNKDEVIEWFETKYKPNNDEECGCCG